MSQVKLSRIHTLLPGAVAICVDRSGMQCAFTTPPIYHHVSNRWIPTGIGRRLDLGLSDTGIGFRPEQAIRWLIDDAGLQHAQEQLQAAYEARTGHKPPPVPSQNPYAVTAPSPSAVDAQITEAELAHKNRVALGLESPAVATPAPAPIQSPREKLTQFISENLSPDKQTQLLALIDELRVV